MRVRIVDLSAVGLVFCGSEERARSLLSRSSEHRTRLQQNPLAILNVVYDEHGRDCEYHRERGDDKVVAIETSTGMTSLMRQRAQDAGKDLEKLTKGLHAANTNLIFLDNVANFEIALGKFIKETMVKLDFLRRTRNLKPVPADVNQVLHQNMDYLINLSELRRYQAQSLHRRVQSQINVVSKTNQADYALFARSG